MRSRSSAALAIALWSCTRAQPANDAAPLARPQSAPDAAVAAPDASAPSAAKPPDPPRAGQEIAIAAGRLWLGSATGSPHRNPAREADRSELQLPAFSIDALPYPNDPSVPPRHSVTRAEAAALCAERGQRLCSEHEWERACKGEDEDEYPSLDSFDAALCAKEPLRCVSAAGVFAMGTLGREWTSSEARRADWDVLRTAVVRGAIKDAPAAAHRCAARDAATPDSKSESLLFRCCRGEPPAVDYPEQPDFAPFREGQVDASAVRAALMHMPETRQLADTFKLWSEKQSTQALSAAGRSQASLAPWQAARAPLLWSPVRGEEIVLVSGDAPQGALVVAYYPLGEGRYRFAGSYETRGEHTPVLIVFKPDARDELLFSTCWQCGGEGGAIRLDAASRVRFLQR